MGGAGEVLGGVGAELYDCALSAAAIMLIGCMFFLFLCLFVSRAAKDDRTMPASVFLLEHVLSE